MDVAMVKLRPVERAVLATIPGVARKRAVLRAVRAKLDDPGALVAGGLPFPDLLRYTVLLGFVRQPLFYIVGASVSALCYMVLIYQVLGG